METRLEDLRGVREASTTLRRMPDPYHQPEPWMNLLENEKEWSKALRQFDASGAYRRTRQKGSSETGQSRMGSAESCCSCQSSTSQPWLQKARSDAPLLMIRALRAVRRLVLVQERWITSLTEQRDAGNPF